MIDAFEGRARQGTRRSGRTGLRAVGPEPADTKAGTGPARP